MQDLVSKMYFKTSKGNLGKKQFQSGISVSIKATLDLFYELKAEGIQYLLTSRINQDGLENLFSTIRLMGGNDSHPSARDFANRMRNLCLTKIFPSLLTIHQLICLIQTSLYRQCCLTVQLTTLFF